MGSSVTASPARRKRASPQIFKRKLLVARRAACKDRPPSDRGIRNRSTLQVFGLRFAPRRPALCRKSEAARLRHRVGRPCHARCGDPLPLLAPTPPSPRGEITPRGVSPRHVARALLI